MTGHVRRHAVNRNEDNTMQRALCSLLMTMLMASTLAHAVDGEYDPSWPGNGRIRLDVSSGADRAEAMMIQPDGKLVIAGTCNGNSFCAARLHPSGSYDASFGNTGLAGRFVQDFFGSTLDLTAIAMAPDGGILLVGNIVDSAEYGVLMKLSASGALLEFFQVSPPLFGGEYPLRAIAVQADGKILVAGTATNGSNDFAVTRLRADLTYYDVSFGDPGAPGTKLVAFPGGGYDSVSAIALQADGKIVLAGDSGGKAALARLLPNGQLDDDPVTGFGDGGRAVFNWGLFSRANAVAIDRDGSLLVAGSAWGSTGPEPSVDFLLNRLSTRGTQAPGFGLLCPPPFCSEGPVYYDWANKDDHAYALAVQNDGKILVSGSSRSGINDLFAVVRFDSAGIPDNTFGNGGQTRSWYGTSAGVDNAKAILIGNGGVMIAGYSRGASLAEARFGIAKLKLDLIFAGGFQ